MRKLKHASDAFALAPDDEKNFSQIHLTKVYIFKLLISWDRVVERERKSCEFLKSSMKMLLTCQTC